MDWTSTGLTEPALQLFLLPGGALLARTQAGLVRNDDADDTWQPVLPPASIGVMAVDPTDPTIWYAVG